MKLFDDIADPAKNWLPRDGTVNYYGRLFGSKEAAYYFERLVDTIDWRNDEAVIFGKRVITRRKVAWYGTEAFEYTYSNVTRQALPWTPELWELRNIVEKHTAETFNSCLLNLYHDGREGMSWHSDGETDLKKDGAIASLSFGAERKFAFRHKTTGEKVELILEHGSLLVMKDATQRFWLHCLPKTMRVTTARINLTFRTIVHASAGRRSP
jgi:alkylated DNA repair dioxygenase AlkB